ncbi:hypothetical protein AB0O34_27125 [Sphaerisporangium sp. NPDC088356]|uniref:hypothetical protein n=1 Tax=Sphaerisporangium sp. NPDC088356 TaxID=3154871 RepID=UPI00344AFFCA
MEIVVSSAFVPLLPKDAVTAPQQRTREVVEYRKSGLSLSVPARELPGCQPSLIIDTHKLVGCLYHVHEEGIHP